MDSIVISLNKFFNEIYSPSAEIVSGASTVAGFLALIYFTYKALSTYGKGESIHVMDLAKPIIILATIPWFGAIVSITETTLSVVTAATDTVVATNNQKLKDLLAKKEKMIEAQDSSPEDRARLYADATDDPDVQKILAEQGPYSSMSKSWTGAKISEVIHNAVIWILQYLVLILRTGMVIISVFFRIILAMIGPFVFALSIFPYFSDNIGNWFARYVNVYLYVPIANIMGLIQSKLMIIQTESTISTIQKGSYEIGGDDISYIIFLGISILGYLQIPTIASWVVQSSGAGNYLSSINQASKGGATKSAQYGAALSGGLGGKFKGAAGHAANSMMNAASSFSNGGGSSESSSEE